LKWSRHDLAEAAAVPLWFVAGFENGDDGFGFLAHWEFQMRDALGLADGSSPNPSAATADECDTEAPALETQEQIDAYVLARLKAL